MPDIFVVILAVMGVVLTGAGITFLAARRRVAMNMETANVIPARIGSSVGYVVALGVGQVVLGAMSFGVAGVMANRRAFGQFCRAIDRVLQLAGVG